MFRQKKKNTLRGSFTTTISAIVSGMALLFLFNHQALAIIICCASEQTQAAPSCHQQMEDRGGDQNPSGSVSHNAVLPAEDKSIATRAAEWSRPLPQCCRTTAPIESEPPLASVNKEVFSGLVTAFIHSAIVTTQSQAVVYSPPDRGSPPVYLITSRLNI